MNENQNPETTPETTTSKLAFLKNRKVRIALAATAAAGVGIYVYKTKTRPEVPLEEVVEAAVTAA